MKPLEEQEIYLLISRHLAFETNAAEDAVISDWIALSKENELVFEQLKTIWLSARKNTAEDTAAAAAFAEFKQRQPPAKAKRPGGRIGILALAACTVFAIAGLFYLQKNKPSVAYIEKSAPAGAKLAFNLDDGTSVCLAPGSKLVYPEKWTTGDRDVRLWGQAYFTVSKDPHRPFIVSCGGLLTEVLGTSFVVSAFDNQGQISVALMDGSVSVTDSAHAFKYRLEPGKELLFDRDSHQANVQDIKEKTAVTAWMNRELVFDNITLEQAAPQIQAVYGVRLVFAGQAAAKSVLWGRFKNETLVNILNSIKIAGNITYTLRPDSTVLISKE